MGLTAAQIIEEIKRLPQVEREAVRDFLSQDENNGELKEPQVNYAGESAVRESSEKIFKQYEDLFRKLAQ